MKQYLRITAVLLVFGLLILLRNLADNSGNKHRIINQSKASFPSGNNTSSSNNTITAPTAPQTNQAYKDGTYTGSVEDAYYGSVQVQAVIAGGKIKTVSFLQYPNDNGTSRYISSQVMPILVSEALKSQSAQVDIVTGASQTSAAFQRSLQEA